MSNPQRSWIVTLLALLFFAAVVGIHAFNEPKNDFHFALLGDRTGGAEPQVFGRVWREIDLLHPDFVLNVGDTIEGGRDERAEQEWLSLRPVWQRYKHYPLYFTPGNHDIWSPRSRELYEKESKRPLSYSFDYQDMHFTVLDNSRSDELSPPQLEFLEQDLKANQGRGPKLIVFHRPYWIGVIRTSGTDFPLHRLAKQYGVEHIISGHGHQFVRIVRDGVTYMEVGSSGGTMRGKFLRNDGFAQGAFYHFVWARVEGRRVHFTVKEIQGPMGLGRMFRAEDWDENGPHFDTADPGSKDKPET
ncbi:MAG: metallophosphoesterase [Acidobacteria bacterium]|nr:metallophosphoesterase [Acidobacteriota bacterium]